MHRSAARRRGGGKIYRMNQLPAARNAKCYLLKMHHFVLFTATVKFFATIATPRYKLL